MNNFKIGVVFELEKNRPFINAERMRREMKNKYSSFTSKKAVTESEVQVLLEGTPENLLSDYSVLDNSSLEYYNYAPTLRYEGFTCTIN